MSVNRLFTPEIIVLKFGSSVLNSLDSFQSAAQEVKRFCDQGYQVIAVVSAIGNTTDHLQHTQKSLFNCHSSHGNNPIAQQATALLLSTGELQSVSYLCTQLLHQGISANLLPKPIHACGNYLDATPSSANLDAFKAIFSSSQVAVVPGFIATNELGETCLLGRGGSDLSALFLTQALNARQCILFKDVSGVYDTDPNNVKNAKCYRFLTYDDARKVAKHVVQNTAILWAKSQYLTFQVGQLNSKRYTTIGALASQFYTEDYVSKKIKEVA